MLDKKASSQSDFVERAKLSVKEFVALAALLSAMGAMSIDIMLPLLPQIGESFAITDENRRQLIVVVFSLGFALGQVFFGPLSDRYGRKAILLSGIMIYLAGSVGSALSGDFEIMLLLRLLQGIGASALRVVTTAVVRDCFAGNAMGRIMTFVFAVFMIVPMAAPFVGQIIGLSVGWRGIFWFLAIMGSVAGVWILFRLAETLPATERRSISPRSLFASFVEICTSRIAAGYSLAALASFASLMGYIVSSQQIFGELYGLGALFPVAFASSAVGVAIVSLLSARLIRVRGARFITHTAMAASAVAGMTLYVINLFIVPPMLVSLALLTVSMSAAAIMQGNAGAIALESLGHIAGTASSIFGMVTMAFGAVIGGLVGQAYDGTVAPLSLAFGIGGILALAFIYWAERGRLFRNTA